MVGYVKDPLYLCPLCSCPYHRMVGPTAQEQIEPTDDDRFACSRLPRQNGKTGPELQGEFIYDGKVADGQF